MRPSTNGDVTHGRANGVGLKMAAVAVQEAVTEEEEAAEEAVEEEDDNNDDECDDDDEDDGVHCDESDVVCGLGRWCSPRWAQRLAAKQVFLVVFSLTSVLQGMFYTYYVSVLTTVERLFQFKSKTTGIIMSATEMGQIGGALLLAYYGGQGHRPKWIGWGMLLFSFCALLSSLPHFLYGEELLRKHLATTPSKDSPLASANLCRPKNFTFDPLPYTTLKSNLTLEADSLLLDPANAPAAPRDCDSPEGETQVVLAIFFLSLLGIGIGQTAAYNLGIPYIDDNIANRETPIYFGEFTLEFVVLVQFSLVFRFL